MANKQKPSEGKIINLLVVKKCNRHRKLSDRTNKLKDLLDGLEAKGIGGFAILSDGETGIRFSTGIHKNDLIDGLVNLFREEPEIYRGLLIEMILAELYAKKTYVN